MKKLELMQKEFIEWLRKTENTINNKEIDFNSLIEKRLIEIAKNNDYKLIYKNDSLGKKMIYLFFQNQKNLKFLGAKTNEEGFFSEEQEDIW